MADFTLNAATRPTVNITTKADDGTETDHPFEVLIMNKHRHQRYMEYAKKALPLQQRLTSLEESGELPTDEEQEEMARMMLAGIDERLKSTNGPCTVSSLWDEGLLSLAHLRMLGDYLLEEATGNPPA